MKFYLSIVLIAFACVAKSQPFLKTYEFPGRDVITGNMVIVPDEGYAFLTGHQIVFVDAGGQILRQWAPVKPDGVLFERMIRTASGKFIVLARKPNTDGILLYMVKQDGTTEKTLDLDKKQFISSLNVIEGKGGDFYISYKMFPPAGNLRIYIQQFDQQGNDIWTRQLPEPDFSNYALVVTPQGGLDISYNRLDDQKLKMVRYSPEGDLTSNILIELDQPAHPVVMKALPGGDHLIGANQVLSGNSEADIVLLRLGTDGKLIRKTVVDVAFYDQLADIEIHDNGIFILSGSYPKGVVIYPLTAARDIVLTHINMEGNLVWKKGFGTHRDEFAAKLLVNGARLLIGGSVTLLNKSFPSTILIETGLDGRLMDNQFPEVIQPVSTIRMVDLMNEGKTTELISSIPTADGGYISSGRIKLNGEEDYTACVFRTNALGQKQWIRLLSEERSNPGNIRATPDGNYVLVLNAYFLGGHQQGFLVKIDGNGNIIWNIYLNAFLPGDVLAPPDGGFLLTGTHKNNRGIFNRLQRLNAKGEHVWLRDFQDPHRTIEGKLIGLTPDQKIVVVSTVLNDAGRYGIHYMKTDLNGIRIKDFEIYMTDSLLVPQCLLTTAAKEVLIGGYAEKMATYKRDAVVLKIDPSNKLLWSQHYDISQRDECLSLLQLGENSFYMAGTTHEPELGSRKKIGFLASLNADGILGKKYFFGDQDSEYNITNVFMKSSNRFQFTGNKSDNYHRSLPCIGSFETDIVLSAGGPGINHSISLYPNPAKASTLLFIKNQYSGNIQVSITGINGVCLKMLQLRKMAGDASFMLPLQGLPAGIYQVEISFGKERLVKPLVGLN